MDKVNWLAKDSFPASTYTFDQMQKATALVAVLALIGGNNYILSGCKEDQTGNVSDGVIVIDGEILPFVGGVKKEKITIKETTEDDHALGIDYPEAYIHRIAQFATDGEYSWTDFAVIVTNKQLEDNIVNIKGDPIGIIKEYAGSVSVLPDEYLPCDGRVLSVNQYPELFEIIRYTYGGNGDTQFNLPNFNGRVSVGFNPYNNDYDLGKAGGVEKVKLSLEQMPEHRHAYTDDTNAQGKYPQIEDGFPTSITGVANVKSSAESSGWGTVYNSQKQGGNQEHENRQPYLVVSKIIKVK